MCIRDSLTEDRPQRDAAFHGLMQQFRPLDEKLSRLTATRAAAQFHRLLEPGVIGACDMLYPPVSYTHLDVYKRQKLLRNQGFDFFKYHLVSPRNPMFAAGGPPAAAHPSKDHIHIALACQDNFSKIQ